MDGGPVLTVLLMETSARQQVLTLFFCLHFSINHVSRVSPQRLGRTKVSWGGRVCKDSLSVRKCIRTGEIIWLALTDLSLRLSLTQTAVKLTVQQICFVVAGHGKSTSDKWHTKRKWELITGQNCWEFPNEQMKIFRFINLCTKGSTKNNVFKILKTQETLFSVSIYRCRSKNS